MDNRRCRRCKRKRGNDEPPAVQQYKTCAKCRVIERKKKGKQPLSEDAMLYGTKPERRSYADQSFSADRYDRKRADKFNHYQPQVNSGYDSTGFLHGLPAQTAAAVSVTAPVPVAEIQAPVPAAVVLPLECQLCDAGLDAADTLLAAYRLCGPCYTDPLRQPNVYGAFNEFLWELSRGRSRDIERAVFIKEVSDHFTDSLGSSRVISSERQFRQFVLESVKTIFVDPVVASIGYELAPVLNNVGEINNKPPSVSRYTNQYQYKQTSPLRLSYKCIKEADVQCDLDVSVVYDIGNNLVVIRARHRLHAKKVDYPPEFFQRVAEIIRGRPETLSDEHTEELAVYVYDRLLEEDRDGLLYGFVHGLSREQFLSDFQNLAQLLEELRSVDAEAGESEAEDEEEEEDDDETPDAAEPLDPAFGSDI